MAWEVEFTDEFEEWWDSLTGDEQDSIDISVGLLEEFGPILNFRALLESTARSTVRCGSFAFNTKAIRTEYFMLLTRVAQPFC